MGLCLIISDMASVEEGICMNYELLQKKIEEYKADLERNPGKHSQEWQDRNELCRFYQRHTSNALSNIDEEGLLEYLSPLWSMLIWGNKRYTSIFCGTAGHWSVCIILGWMFPGMTISLKVKPTKGFARWVRRLLRRWAKLD